ncbi:DegT/DnrJ/EryC1/StrS family aminotransferase [Lysobacter sp. A378]
MKRIPLLVPQMPRAEQLLPYLVRIDRNRQYTNFGPLNAEFERRLIVDSAPGLGIGNITTVSNCTVGLELALQALDLPPHAKILIPAITFVATATAVIRAGFIPVIGDVDPDTWCLSPSLAEAAFRSDAIAAVMPVATFGRPHNVDEWDAFTGLTGVPVIIDAAGAYGNQSVGTSTDVVYSFHATKSFGAAEGGAVISSNKDRIRMIRRLANFGIDTTDGRLQAVGTNGKMSEYHCAVGLASFDEWAETKSARIELYARYSESLRRTCSSLTFQEKPVDGIYPLMPVLLPPGVLAIDIYKDLLESGVETRRWYCPPLHTHPALMDMPVIGELSVAEDMGSRILGLPYYIGMSDVDIEFVCDRLDAALCERREKYQ